MRYVSDSNRPQISLRLMFGLMTGLCVLFGFLHLAQATPFQSLVAFAACSLAAAIGMALCNPWRVNWRENVVDELRRRKTAQRQPGWFYGVGTGPDRPDEESDEGT